MRNEKHRRPAQGKTKNRLLRAAIGLVAVVSAAAVVVLILTGRYDPAGGLCGIAVVSAFAFLVGWDDEDGEGGSER